MAKSAEVLYTQTEAEAIIGEPKSFKKIGFIQRIGDPSEPRRVQLSAEVDVVSTLYDPKDFGKEVRLVFAIRRHDGFSFMLILDRTVLFQVDYQWRKGRKPCPCRSFEMDYEPHVHAYDEACYRNRRKLYLDELPTIESSFDDALQEFLRATNTTYDDRLDTRFAQFKNNSYWGKASQATLFPLSGRLDVF